MKKLFCGALCGMAIMAALAVPAQALFDVKNPLSKMYASSRLVISGNIESINIDNHVLQVKPLTVYKGTAPESGVLRFKITQPEALGSQVRVGQPVVIFQAARNAAVHMADHWYSGEPLATPGVFNINGSLSPDHDETFPGKTADLVKAVAEIKSGKSTILDVFPDIKLPAVVKVATLPGDALAFTACRLPNEKDAVFFVATAAGLRAFSLEGGKATDVTAKLHLEHLQPRRLAAVSSPKDAFLFIDDAVYVDFDLGHFEKAGAFLPPPQKILALAPGESSAPMLFFLTPQGLERTPFPPERTHGEPPDQLTSTDDATRLTGTKLTDYHKAHSGGYSTASLAAVDINHDHRPDLVILTPEGTLTLLNRGFGGYIVNKDFAAPLLDPGNTGKPSLPFIAGTDSTLWLLQKDGTLYRCDFPAK